MTTPTFRCNALSIVVSDMARGIEFFSLCGLPITGNGDEPHVECEVVPGFKVMLDSEASVAAFHPGWSAPTSSRSSLAVECASPAEVDAAHGRVVAAGFGSELDPFDAFWGQRYATVRDEDGNTVDFYAPTG